MQPKGTGVMTMEAMQVKAGAMAAAGMVGGLVSAAASLMQPAVGELGTMQILVQVSGLAGLVAGIGGYFELRGRIAAEREAQKARNEDVAEKLKRIEAMQMRVSVKLGVDMSDLV